MMSESAGTTRKPTVAPWLALPLVLAILGLAIFMTMRHLRTVLVQKIAQQDGYVLYAASKVQIDPEFAKDPELRPIAIENRALEAAQLLTNIIAMRLYDSSGQSQFLFPDSVKPNELSPSEFESARQLHLTSELQETAKLGDIFDGIADQGGVPLLRIVVPLVSDGGLIGIAEFWMDGRNVQTAVRAVDADLWRYGILIFVAGGTIMALAVGFAFSRLQRSNKLLAQRTSSLLRANHELTLSAKTSAIGAIAAHLIHDLKSPLFGLQTFVAAKSADSTQGNDDWRLALSTTEKMQKLISDVVRVLQEEKTTTAYEMTIDEVLGLIQSKVAVAAKDAGIKFRAESAASATLLNRDANIALLVLTNIVQNAIQAVPRDGEIAVKAMPQGNDLVFEVTDTGPGLPPHIQKTLFTPSRSTKTGGTGLGLAISKQLANHAGAELTLKETSPKGTTFELRLPEKMLAASRELASDQA